MAITIQQIKELREATAAGMGACKEALTATNGNMEEAVKYLREKGLAVAAKRVDKESKQGIVALAAADDGKSMALAEVNCETDFVAKNDEFKKFVTAVAKQALKTDAADIDAFLGETWNEDGSKTVKEALVDKIATIGENLSIRRFKKVSADGGALVSYIHGGGRIAVLVKAEADGSDDKVKEALSNIAMQIAALNPKYISDGDIEQSYIEHETEIIRAQIENDPKEAAKPDKVKEGMIKGRINKQMKEVCLLDQVYVKAEDGKQNVAKYLEQVGKDNGTTVTLSEFVRFETGEGMEKKEENFAEEVAKQMQ